ncbi:hypothetical protein CDL15_Pgr005057 [Punica granatum]|uniref:Uncharacterized protein n=1 Tax=Punica granatum TaxID=22663 RepID=A0A218W2T7_PUNGR|nr:hypothetical protein CDL15_Pgr005057 [Punica granatum]PKI60630.1 hypothetical protein CRG98_018980 [Punica granatum]
MRPKKRYGLEGSLGVVPATGHGGSPLLGGLWRQTEVALECGSHGLARLRGDSREPRKRERLGRWLCLMEWLLDHDLPVTGKREDRGWPV